MNDKERNRINRKIKAQAQAKINKYGFQVTGVFDSEEFPTFAYTAGLTAYELPELIAVGLPLQMSQSFLNQIGNEMADGKKFALRTPYFGYCSNDDFPMAFIKVCEASKNELMTVTQKFYKQFDAWQFVWSDTKGNLPWHDCYEQRFHKYQPLLGNCE